MPLPRRLLPLLLATASVAAQPTPPVFPEFRFEEVSPALASAAGKAGLPLEGFRAADGVTGLQQGDQVVALVDEAEGERHRQWLVLLAPRDLTAEEQKLPPPPATRMYTSTGHGFDYAGRNAIIAIRCLGPYTVAPSAAVSSRKARDRWSGALVNDAFLRLGLDESCRMWLRIEEAARAISARENRPVDLQLDVGPVPFPPPDPAATAQVAPALRPEESELRAFAGSFLALTSFFTLAARTPGLDDPLRAVISIPWLSIVARGGSPAINIQYGQPLRVLAPEPWGLSAGTPLYACPLLIELNGKLALRCQLAVRSPQPPFLACAGIVGVAAARPDGKGPTLSLRVIAARCGPPPAVAAATP